MFQLTFDIWIPRLTHDLPQKYYYHSVDHTLQVLESAQIIGLAENISDSDMELLQVAAVLHDSGFLKSHVDHEAIGCELARDFLKNLDISDLDLEKVCSMIMATKIPQSPKNKLDEIICDADLSYFGTDDYDTIANLLFMELGAIGKSLEQKAWLDLQINFLESHAFFTDYARLKFNQVKKKHLIKLKGLRKALK